MATNASNTLRMSGMNSGFDTEAIVNAMTANTKLKITKQERKLLTLQNTQTAYRDIISNIQSFQKKYFNVLNPSTYLKGSTIFSKYSASTSINGESKNVAGVTVSTSFESSASDYSVKVNNVAKQASVKSVSLSDNARIDASAYSDAGQTYSFTASVGGAEKVISFNGSSDAQTVRNNINDALCEAYGNSNTSASNPSVHEGLVYVNASGQFVSSNKNAITVSGVSTLAGSSAINLSNLNTGRSTLQIQNGSEVVNISIDSVKSDYFDETVDENGEFLETATDAMKDLYTQVKNDLVESYAYSDYNEWKNSAGYETEKQTLLDNAFAEADAANFDKRLNTFLEEKYHDSGSELTLEEWKTANYEQTEGNALYDEFALTYFDQYDENGELTSSGSQLDKAIWSALSYNEYSSYKANMYTADPDMDTSTDAVISHFNRSNAISALSSVTFKDGTSLKVEATAGDTLSVTAKNANGDPVSIAITAAAGSANNMGAVAAATSTNQVSTSTKLSEIGLTPDESGNYSFTINGETLTFGGETTVKEMMKSVNASDAGVTMSYSSLKNQFTLTSEKYGVDEEITFSDGAEGLLGALGFNASSTFTAGENLEVEINGEVIQAANNSVTVDGTTFKFTDAAEGAEFNTTTKRDYSEAIDAVKSFVEDYNKLIETVYGYLDEKPDKDYHFLTEDEIDEMELSDKQQEKWESKAKLGLLYNDSTVSSIMSEVRTALYGGVTAADGTTVALYTMGIKTSTDYSDHGKLTLDEKALAAAFENYADEIGELFTDSTNGIMIKASAAFEKGVNSTGTDGSLITKAGSATGSSATDNDIYNQMKRIKELITSLNERYENQQERYWSVYSNMEKQLSNLNSQTSYISSMLGS